MDSSPPPPPESDSTSARQRILDVAVDEFSSKGFASVRIDTIAARANANKQLIYYYFSSKSGLYDAVLDRLVDEYRPMWQEMRQGNLDDMIRVRSEHAHEGLVWRRLLAWEGLEYWENRQTPVRREEIRKTAYDIQREVVERAQHDGHFPVDIDARFASLLLLFASLGPVAFPQITQLVTGLEPDDPAVVDGVDRVVTALLRRASPDQRRSGPNQ
jgi:AcrR family transcriptional regulator